MKKLISYLLLLCLFFVPVASAKFVMLVQGGETCTAEDLSGYTDFDGGSDFSFTSTTITLGAGFEPRYITYYLYTDKTAGYYNGNFKFRVKENFSVADTGSYFFSLFLANTAGADANDIAAASGDGIGIRHYENGFKLAEINNGTLSTSSGYTFSLSTDYYLEFERNEAVGTYGTLYLRIYSDSGYTTLLDTLSLTLTEAQDFRYLYAISSYDTDLFHLSYHTGTVSDICEY